MVSKKLLSQLQEARKESPREFASALRFIERQISGQPGRGESLKGLSNVKVRRIQNLFLQDPEIRRQFEAGGLGFDPEAKTIIPVGAKIRTPEGKLARATEPVTIIGGQRADIQVELPPEEKESIREQQFFLGEDIDTLPQSRRFELGEKPTPEQLTKVREQQFPARKVTRAQAIRGFQKTEVGKKLTREEITRSVLAEEEMRERKEVTSRRRVEELKGTTFREVARERDTKALLDKIAAEGSEKLIGLGEGIRTVFPGQERLSDVERGEAERIFSELGLTTFFSPTLATTAQIRKALEPQKFLVSGVSKGGTEGKRFVKVDFFDLKTGQKGSAIGSIVPTKTGAEKIVTKSFIFGGTVKKGVNFPFQKALSQPTSTFTIRQVSVARPETAFFKQELERDGKNIELLIGKEGVEDVSMGKTISQAFSPILRRGFGERRVEEFIGRGFGAKVGEVDIGFGATVGSRGGITKTISQLERFETQGPIKFFSIPKGFKPIEQIQDKAIQSVSKGIQTAIQKPEAVVSPFAVPTTALGQIKRARQVTKPREKQKFIAGNIEQRELDKVSLSAKQTQVSRQRERTKQISKISSLLIQDEKAATKQISKLVSVQSSLKRARAELRLSQRAKLPFSPRFSIPRTPDIVELDIPDIDFEVKKGKPRKKRKKRERDFGEEFRIFAEGFTAKAIGAEPRFLSPKQLEKFTQEAIGIRRAVLPRRRKPTRKNKSRKPKTPSKRKKPRRKKR